MKLTKTAVKNFQNIVLTYFRNNGRLFPWRTSFDPYHILVSEVMLQQTQTERVTPKFEAFISRFPTVESLAEGSQAEVLKLWQGLGYNRRGMNLHRAAIEISEKFGGKIPADSEQLMSLPGIGPYTLSAIQAFAFNQPVVVIETNIRAVYIHHFFSDQSQNIKPLVKDSQLVPLIEQTLDRSQPRVWYSALMDYGSYLKSQVPNPTRRSHHYTKQSKFEGSPRQLRGQILKLLTTSDSTTVAEIHRRTKRPLKEVKKIVEQLERESFITKQNGTIRLK